MNLFSSLFASVSTDPDRVFLVAPDGTEMTYAQMARRSAVFAACLRDAGVRKGQRLLVQVEKSADAVALYLAALRLGVVYVPLNPAYTVAEVQYFLADSRPALFVCAPARQQEMAAVSKEGDATLLTLGINDEGTLAQRAADSQPLKTVAEVDDSDTCAMLYTSGTTGRSKGALLSVDNLRSNAEALCRLWRFNASDVLLHALPVFHVHGLFVALHCAMLSGSRMLFLPRFRVSDVRRLLPRATVMMGVPTFYQRLLAEPAFGEHDCSNTRLLVSGSAPLPPAVFTAFEKRTGMRLLERYGMTETGMIASNPLAGRRLPGSVGFALPGVALRVVRHDGSPAPSGETGSIEVAGPGVFSGYWQQAEKTADSFRVDGFFRTGDAGHLTRTGRLYLAGRNSDVIISGGLNIYPAEIEQAIDALPGVSESAVVAAPHADLGEAVVAVIAGQGGIETAAELAAELAGTLARFKLPRRVFRVASLPRNAMGKVQKGELRKRFRQAFASEAGATLNPE